MSHDGLLSEPTLIEMWRVGVNACYDLRVAGQLVSDVQEDATPYPSHYYTYRTIGAFHRRIARGFTAQMPVPPLSRLLEASGRSLLTTAEVAARLDITETGVTHLVRAGRLPVLILSPETFRFPARYIGRLATLITSGQVVSGQLVCRILCTQPQTITRILRGHYGPAKTLERVRVPKSRGMFVSRTSLLALLTELLPSYVTPEEWWQMRVEDDTPLVSRDVAARRWHMTGASVTAKLEQDRLPYIRTPGNNTLISEQIVAAHEVDPTVSPRTIARLFGWRESRADELVSDHAGCSVTPRVSFCTRRECILQYLADNLASPLLAHKEWWHWCCTDRMKPVLGRELQEQTLAEPGMITAALADGSMRGVWLPGRTEVAIMHADALRFQRRIERMMDGPDYRQH